MYMRESISAQSWLSVPPAPACTSTIGVVAVGLAREQRLHLLSARLRGELLEARLALVDGGLVVLGFAQLDQGDRIIELALELLVAADGALERLALAHQLLRRLRVAPEVGILRALVQVFQACGGAIPVKDASAAGPATGGWNSASFSASARMGGLLVHGENANERCSRLDIGMSRGSVAGDRCFRVLRLRRRCRWPQRRWRLPGQAWCRTRASRSDRA